MGLRLLSSVSDIRCLVENDRAVSRKLAVCGHVAMMIDSLCCCESARMSMLSTQDMARCSRVKRRHMSSLVMRKMSIATITRYKCRSLYVHYLLLAIN